MVQDPCYGYSVRAILNLLDACDPDTCRIKDEATQNSILAIQTEIKMIVNVLKREIPDDQ